MNILIIKIGALGDVARTSFIAQALKDKYRANKPRVVWVTDIRAKPFFVNNPYVDQVVIKEEKQQLLNESWDLVINLEEDSMNCRFASSLKKKKLIGFYEQSGKIFPTDSVKEWFNMSALGEKPKNDILKKRNKKTHRQILSEIIGVSQWKKYEPFFRLTNSQRKIASNFMRRHNLVRGDLIVGINTGSADRWPKQLSVEKTAELIDILSKELNAKILLFGGPNEIERNRQIISLSRSHVIDTGCGNDLVEFPAFISVCSIFITTDSLGLHIALALKRKTVCLVGPTSANEIDLYGLGIKVVADSKCLCCYKNNCKSMEKINIKKVFAAVKDLLKIKITLLITAFKEPMIAKVIESAFNQKTNYDYDILVSAPDEPTLNIARAYAKKYKKIKIFKDPGKGKSYALNQLFSLIKTDILILTDGDVLLSENSVEEIINLFLNPEIGCVTGRPVPMENKKFKYGYWANFLFNAAHNIRKEAFESNSFIECSGYLFAFLKDKINMIPKDVAEDSIIPYYFWQKGYKIGYAEKAQVFVKNPDNFGDWIKQKTRTSKAHEKLDVYADTKTTPRVKTFSNEIKGINFLFTYPKSLKELFWTVELFFARAFVWTKFYFETKLIDSHYGDAWERVESTKQV